MDMSSSFSKIPTFNGTQEDWPSFKAKIILHLERFDLDDMILSNIESTVSATVDLKQTKRARAIIMLGLDDDTQAAMAHHKTAHAVFQALQETYERKARGNLLRALQAYWSLAMDDDEPVTKWIARVQAAAKRVQAHNVDSVFSSMNEQDVVNRILAGLTDTFATVVTHIDSFEDSSTMGNLTIAKLCSQLQNVESQLMPSKTSIIGANAAYTQQLEQELSALKAQLGAGPKRRPLRVESTCSIPHHRHLGGDDACYVQHPELRRLATKDLKNSVYGFHRSFSAMSSTSDAVSEVLADSGCSNHMFRDLSSFTDYVKFNGPGIHLGDNTVIGSSGHGSVDFQIADKSFTTNDVLHVPALGKSLFSLGQSTGQGIKYLLDGDFMTIYSKSQFPATRRSHHGSSPQG